MKRPKIALFDLDGTLADYDGQLLKDLQRIASHHEPPPDIYQNISYIEARRHVITSQSGWFRHLPKFKLGWDVLEVAKEIGYSISILTKAPSRKHAAWSEKVEWCANHLEEYIDGVTIAHDKGMVYGAMLVDDWPEYIEAWLKHRPRGLVIMPANGHNVGFSHPNVVRYDGSNLEEVRQRMQERFDGLVAQSKHLSDKWVIDGFRACVRSNTRLSGECVQSLQQNWSQLTEKCRNVIICELEEAFRLDDLALSNSEVNRVFDNAGRSEWEKLRMLYAPVYDIADLASRVTKENRPAPEDVDFGKPVGKEKL